ncbi:MAG: HD family phosphohydrolase [Bdellovibrionaceae bacterium]|nr:HD family phosphohydrolase [Pseudobdellovibrionaceae bacterium]|tara:strand:+ start:89047 stop:91473 length:2427 start_codon:yes stop_codon:yes gene_type:complete
MKQRNSVEKKKNGKQKSVNRSKYQDQGDQFLNWVNSLGIERTFLGKMLYLLESSFKVRMTALLFVCSIFLAFLINLEFDPIYTGYKEGDIAAIDIRSPITFEMVDEIATAEKRVRAEESVPPIFRYDRDIYESLFDRVYSSFKEMRGRLVGTKWSRSEFKKDKQISEFLQKNKERFEEILGKQVDDRVFLFLAEQRFSIDVANLLVNLLEPYVGVKIIADLGPLQLSKREAVILSLDGKGDELKFPVNEIADLRSIQRDFVWPRNLKTNVLKTKGRRTLAKFAENLLSANMILMRDETKERRQKARNSVVKVNLSIKKGQVIVSEGSTFQPQHIIILDQIRRLNQKRQTDLMSFAMAVLFVSLILVMFSYVRRYSSVRIRIENRHLGAILSITIISVLITKLALFLNALSPLDEVGLPISDEFFHYLNPIGVAGMMLALLVTNIQIIWMFCIFIAVVTGVLLNFSFTFMVVSLFAGIAAARGVFSFSKRNDIYYAGIRTGLVQMLVIAVLTYLSGGERLWFHIAWNSAAGFMSGVLASMIATSLIPIFESVFNFTTDVRLLELSNLNHPLLKEMIVKAPGTYHHCIVVGTMCEAACEEIGANALLAKVGAYYHDIGKSLHPEYFVENQKKEFNPHDHISPNMSKTILVAHVKDGVEMGERYKLGKPIIDIIRQHHGTSLIAYFYNKAKQSENEALHSAREEDFRYPGPKPQFKEAGVVMLADSIEAAARSLDEPTPVRLQNIVKNVIHNKFMDGQLEACALTLRDLKIIEKSFIRTLLTIYHQRIDYPKEAGGRLSEYSPSTKSNIVN